MPSSRHAACIWHLAHDASAREYAPAETRVALPGCMRFHQNASESQNRRAFSKYFALARSLHTMGTRTRVRLWTVRDRCIFCDKQQPSDGDWENLNRRRGGPVMLFHDEKDVSAVLAGGASFDTVTDNVRKRAAQDPQTLAYGGFCVQVEREGREPIHTCDGCASKLCCRAATAESMRAASADTLQLLRTFWEQGAYAQVCSLC